MDIKSLYFVIIDLWIVPEHICWLLIPTRIETIIDQVWGNVISLMPAMGGDNTTSIWILITSIKNSRINCFVILDVWLNPIMKIWYSGENRWIILQCTTLFAIRYNTILFPTISYPSKNRTTRITWLQNMRENNYKQLY
jgi:hypothetical protein